jgi:N-acetylglucosaminyldiphosphoundecaprenol N-acetyl-beta-D-mannosaminyltransferase
MTSKKISITDEFIEIFGIKFLKGGYSSAVKILSKGGFMIVPSAPSLTIIKSDEYYFDSLKASDFAIADSGLMVLILKMFYKIHLEKLSGLAFLRLLFSDCSRAESPELFLVEPTEEDHDENQKYLNNIGVNYDSNYYYIAPIYKDNVIEDFDLLKRLEEQKPKTIIINLGGGVQEKLGYFLKTHLSYKPAIICTGAAIAFLSGRQANIPDWGDRLYLGWLFRCISNPRRFVPRYLSSIKLIFMLIGCKVEKIG